MKRFLMISIFGLVAAGVCLPGSVYARNGSGGGNPGGGYQNQGVRSSWPQDEDYDYAPRNNSERDRHREAVRAQRRRQMMRMAEEDPELFKEVAERFQQRRVNCPRGERDGKGPGVASSNGGFQGKGLPDAQACRYQDMFSRRWEKMQRIKQDDPERFHQEMTERSQRFRERLSDLRGRDPEKFEQVRERIYEAKVERLRELQQQDPQKFQEMIRARKENFYKRLQTLKTEDPAKYERIKVRMTMLKQYKKMYKENPEEFRTFLDEHPRFKNMMERHPEQFETDSTD